MAKKLFGETRDALSMGFDAVRHVAWFVSYHVNRTARDAKED